MSRIYIKISLSYALVIFIGTVMQAQINFFNSTIDKAMAVAHQHDKNILVYYTADWCLPCQVLEESHFKDESVTYLMNNYYLAIKADFDTEKDKPWFELQNIMMLPTVAIFDENMNVLSLMKNIRTIEQLNITLTRHAKKDELVRRELASNIPVENYDHAPTKQSKVQNVPAAMLVSHNEPSSAINSMSRNNLVDDSDEKVEVKTLTKFDATVEDNITIGTNTKSTKRDIIQFGAFTKYDNAINQLYALRDKTIDAFILEEKRGNVKYYKVVESSSNPNEKLAVYKAQGVDCFSRVF